MSLHADECTVPRRCSREQPSRPAEGKKPATISQLRRSSPLACWRYQRDKTGVFPVEGGFSPVIPARPRPVTPGSGLPFKNHGGPPSAVTTGGVRRALPRIGRRHLFFRSGSSAGVASGAESRSARRWERPTTRGLLVRFQSPVQQCDGSRSNARPRHGGWTCCVEQGRYGHYARKPTLLYAVGCELPDLDWGIGKPRLDPAVIERMGLKRAKRLGEVGARGGGKDSTPRIGTPPAFRDLLISMARSAAGTALCARLALEAA